MKTTINPYLIFDGNCEEAFLFYRSVFQSEFSYIGRFSEIPPQENFKVPEEFHNRILHVSLPISEGFILMGSDDSGYNDGNQPGFIQGNNISININLGKKEEADSLYEKLSEGGKILMPMSVTFWNAYFGMFCDKFGINWMINVEIN